MQGLGRVSEGKITSQSDDGGGWEFVFIIFKMASSKVSQLKGIGLISGQEVIIL